MYFRPKKCTQLRIVRKLGCVRESGQYCRRHNSSEALSHWRENYSCHKNKISSASKTNFFPTLTRTSRPKKKKRDPCNTPHGIIARARNFQHIARRRARDKDSRADRVTHRIAPCSDAPQDCRLDSPRPFSPACMHAYAGREKLMARKYTAAHALARGIAKESEFPAAWAISVAGFSVILCRVAL